MCKYKQAANKNVFLRNGCWIFSFCRNSFITRFQMVPSCVNDFFFHSIIVAFFLSCFVVALCQSMLTSHTSNCLITAVAKKASCCCCFFLLSCVWLLTNCRLDCCTLIYQIEKKTRKEITKKAIGSQIRHQTAQHSYHNNSTFGYYNVISQTIFFHFIFKIRCSEMLTILMSFNVAQKIQFARKNARCEIVSVFRFWVHQPKQSNNKKANKNAYLICIFYMCRISRHITKQKIAK